MNVRRVLVPGALLAGAFASLALVPASSAQPGAHEEPLPTELPSGLAELPQQLQPVHLGDFGDLGLPSESDPVDNVVGEAPGVEELVPQTQGLVPQDLVDQASDAAELPGASDEEEPTTGVPGLDEAIQGEMQEQANPVGLPFLNVNGLDLQQLLGGLGQPQATAEG